MKQFVFPTKGKLQLSLMAGMLGLVYANAADYRIDSYSIGSGGTGSGGSYQVSGTVQLLGAAQFAGGAYEVADGFWTVVMAVQSPEAPQLSIVRNGSNLTISWPSDISGFILEEASTLNSPIVWQPTSGVTGSSLIISLTAGPKFYRLKKP
ncbi:MAG TPA: hypothetical protein VGH19_14605 [Verrucomicrobiae bacterium]